MRKSKAKRYSNEFNSILKGSYNALYGFVLHTFKSINRKIRSQLPVSRIEEETLEHVHSAVKVFKWIILPTSLICVFASLCLFGVNVLASILWGILIFFYSNFLPDLPFIYRRKDNDQKGEDLQWHKKYALLLFAPILIWILFSEMKLKWETIDTFHNFKSLAVYGIFLLMLGFFAFVKFPISLGNITEIVAIPLYGTIGYLTHLKVDKIC